MQIYKKKIVEQFSSAHNSQIYVQQSNANIEKIFDIQEK